MNPTIRSKIIFGVASTMKHLHKKHCLLNFLKIDNVILDENFEPVISDFRFATFSSSIGKSMRTQLLHLNSLKNKILEIKQMFLLLVSLFIECFSKSKTIFDMQLSDGKGIIKSPNIFLIRLLSGANLVKPDNS